MVIEKHDGIIFPDSVLRLVKDDKVSVKVAEIMLEVFYTERKSVTCALDRYHFICPINLVGQKTEYSRKNCLTCGHYRNPNIVLDTVVKK